MPDHDHEIHELIKTATAFVDELKAFGLGDGPDLPLPGSYDPFVMALDAAREKLMDRALGQDNGDANA